jgi:hypothetical protein
MARRQVRVLLGIKESIVSESVKAVLVHRYQATTTFNFVASGGLDDFIHEASSGNYLIAFLAPNCLLSLPPDMLGHSIRAVQAVSASCSVTLVILTPVEGWLQPLRSAGADLCLQTPFTSKQLTSAVDSLVQCGL